MSDLRAFKDKVAWIADNLAHPEIDFAVTEAAMMRGITDAEVYAYIKEHYTKQWLEAQDKPKDDGVKLADFVAYMPAHQYIFKPLRDLWPAPSVDARLPWPEGSDGKAMRPSKWLDQYAPVEQMTWMPGEPMMIRDKLMETGGLIDRAGCACFNQYRAPSLKLGDASKAEPWLDHVHMVYPDDKEHIINWLAQRVQQPQVKINHALVLGGEQGVGKDTLIESVKEAVGPWNCNEISPAAMLGQFNGFVKSVILRINEARDLGDVDRFKFYDHTKTLIAAPPDVVRVNEKHMREYAVPNVTGVVITTNHKTNGLYLPATDRRHYVAWSRLPAGALSEAYFTDLYKWFANGGHEHVAAYLTERDLSRFDPKAPPRKTDAFWVMVNAGRAPEDSELADILDELNKPAAVHIGRLVVKARAMGYTDFEEFLTERKSRTKIPHRMEDAGYEPVRNPDAKDGHWRIEGKRQAVYGRKDLDISGQITAARNLS